MKPITNILLVLALICYVFLPFYDISLLGTVTGLGFTAGRISQSLSVVNVLFALLPFIAIFGAIALNCMKNRWWVLGSIALIIVGLWFFAHTSSYHDIMLRHDPEITPDNDLGEGFSITGLGIGHTLSFILIGLSLLSAIISLLPFNLVGAIASISALDFLGFGLPPLTPTRSRRKSRTVPMKSWMPKAK